MPRQILQVLPDHLAGHFRLRGIGFQIFKLDCLFALQRGRLRLQLIEKTHSPSAAL